jgi:transposase
LCRQDAPQREYPLRDVYNALRWLVRAGAPWQYLPTDFPPCEIGVSADPALDRRRLLRDARA